MPITSALRQPIINRMTNVTPDAPNARLNQDLSPARIFA
jgi:hypothetical protein